MLKSLSRKSKSSIFSWCVFDWGHSAFPTLVITFIFSTYFAKSVASNTIIGTSLWGYALAVAGIIAALGSPIVGAWSDKYNRLKAPLAICVFICCLCTVLLFFVKPEQRFVMYALCVFVIADIHYEFTQVLYNSMLLRIAPKKMIGRISGWGWGIGYFGGLCCLALALLFIQTHIISHTQDLHIRSTMILAGVWFAVFALPLFFFTTYKKEIHPPTKSSIFQVAFAPLKTIRQIKKHKNILMFLLAHLLYIDGLNTIFEFGGIYASGTFHMTFGDILLFAIAINVTAGLGAIGMSWLDDYKSPKLVIALSLIGLTICTAAILMVHSIALFWIFALALGVFVGPTQAASRSLLTRLAPKQQIGEMFGLYNFSGRITSFIGPLSVGLLTSLFKSQRIGLGVTIVLLLIGFILLMYVKNPKQIPEPG